MDDQTTPMPTPAGAPDPAGASGAPAGDMNAPAADGATPAEPAAGM